MKSKTDKEIKKEKIGDMDFDDLNKVWDVVMARNEYFECGTQYQAEVLSQLVQIKALLKELKK